MVRTNTHFDEEFNPSEHQYILYAHDTREVTSEYHNDTKRDETYEETTSEDIGTQTAYFQLSEVKIDTSVGGRGRVRRHPETLKKLLFNKVVESYEGENDLYDEYDVSIDSDTFNVFPEHNGTHYILVFEQV